jgi:putative acetyltransferase
MFRAGRPRDFDALFPIYMDPVTNRFLGLEIMDKKDFQPILKDLTEEDTLYVSQNPDGQIAATCIVSAEDNRCDHCFSISFFATNSKFQRQGVGSKFLKEVIEKIRIDPHITRIEILVDADNEPALNFFKKHGFQQEAVLKKGCKRKQDANYVDINVMALTYE